MDRNHRHDAPLHYYTTKCNKRGYVNRRASGRPRILLLRLKPQTAIFVLDCGRRGPFKYQSASGLTDPNSRRGATAGSIESSAGKTGGLDREEIQSYSCFLNRLPLSIEDCSIVRSVPKAQVPRFVSSRPRPLLP